MAAFGIKHLNRVVACFFTFALLLSPVWPTSSSAEDGAVKRTLDAMGPQCLALPNGIRILYPHSRRPTITDPNPVITKAIRSAVFKAQLQAVDPIVAALMQLTHLTSDIHRIEATTRTPDGETHTLQFDPGTFSFNFRDPADQRVLVFDGKGLVEISLLLHQIWKRLYPPPFGVTFNRQFIELQLNGLIATLQGNLKYIRTLKQPQISPVHGNISLPILSTRLGEMLVSRIETRLAHLTKATQLIRSDPAKALVTVKEFFALPHDQDYQTNFLQSYALTDLEFRLVRDALRKQFGGTHPLVARMDIQIRQLALASEVFLLEHLVGRHGCWTGWLHRNRTERLELLTSPFFNLQHSSWEEDHLTVFRLDHEGWSDGFFSAASDFGKDLKKSQKALQSDQLPQLAARHSQMAVGNFSETTPFGDELGSIDLPTFRTPFVATSLALQVVLRLYSGDKSDPGHRVYILRIPKHLDRHVVNYWGAYAKLEFELLLINRSLPQWHVTDVPAGVLRPGGIAPHQTHTPYDLTVDFAGRVERFKNFRDNLPAAIREKVDREMLVRLYLDPTEFQRARKDSPHPQWVNRKGAWKGWLEAQALIIDLSGHDSPITPKRLSKIHRLVLKYTTTNEQGPLSPGERQRRRSPSFMKDYRMVFHMPEITPVTQLALEEVKLTRTEPLPEGGFDVYMAPAVEIPLRLEETTTLINEKIPMMQAPYQAARVWRRYVAAGSYWDGNGRMGRLLRDLILLRHGMVPALMDKPTEDLTVPDIQLELRIIRGMHRYMNTYRALASQMMQQDE